MVTRACLSAILLAGLVLSATLGWWWADPIAALAIAALAANDGREAWARRNLRTTADSWSKGSGSCPQASTQRLVLSPAVGLIGPGSRRDSDAVIGSIATVRRDFV